MNTVGWVLILVGLLVVRGISRGRSITDLPTDLGDMLTGLLSADLGRVNAVLARKTDTTVDTPTAGSGAVLLSAPSAGRHTQADLIALGKSLQAQGFSVTEGPPPFGPIHRVHAPNSYHYRKGETGVEGMALDVNYDKAGQGVENAQMDALAPLLVSQGWRVAWKTTGHYDHLHVDTGPAGRLKL